MSWLFRYLAVSNMKAKTLLWLLHTLLTFSIARANETMVVKQAQAWRKEMQVAQKSAYHSVRWQKVGSLVMGASEIKVFNHKKTT